jgi:hypothetical protein
MKIIFPFSFQGWPNCVSFSNEIIELVATTDIGPRIIRFGFIGEKNQFVELKETLGDTGGTEWKNYGGHRLWYAPEDPVRTYFPDNSPIKYENHEDFIRLSQPVEPTSGIQKEIDISLSIEDTRVKIIHRLINHSLWSLDLAPWAISVIDG